MRLLLLAVSLSIGCLAQPAAPTSFIQMTDPQFGMYAADRGFDHETLNLEFAIRTANRLKPAFVIITGDLVNKPGDTAQVGEYKRVTGMLDRSIALYHVPGNHDIGAEATCAQLEAYRKALGRDYYSFRAGDLYAIVLNTMLFVSPKGCPEAAAKQEAWLQQELEKARQSKAGHLVVFQHHPLFLKDAEEPDEYFNVPIEARRRLIALFQRYGVSHVFAGHLHRNVEGQAGSLRMVVTGPAGKPLGQDQSGLRIGVIRNGTLEHRYYGFGVLPHKIE